MYSREIAKIHAAAYPDSSQYRDFGDVAVRAVYTSPRIRVVAKKKCGRFAYARCVALSECDDATPAARHWWRGVVPKGIRFPEIAGRRALKTSPEVFKSK